MRTDAYQKITDRIVAELERCIRLWLKPWSAGNTEGKIVRPFRANGVAYRGINVLMLWSEAVAKGYCSPIWMTYRQAQELGAHVRKGEEGSLVVYAEKIIRSETGEEAECRAIPFMKGYTVFNTEQIEGLPEHYYPKPAPRTETIPRIARAEAFVSATGAAIRHGGNMAFYNITLEYVQMPIIEAFKDVESYYATLAHELTHWTRHKTHLNRDFGRKRFGDQGYAMEERRVPWRDTVRHAGLCTAVWQGAERTYQPSLAGDCGAAAFIAPSATEARG